MKTLLISLTLFLTSLAVSAGGGYEPGDKAADFNLKNVDGTYVSLSDYEDEKGVILIFTCNHCPYAQKYEKRIMQLDKKYDPKGYPVVAISPNDPELVPEDSFENMKKRAEKMDYTFPYLLDEKQNVYPKYGATKTPHVFILENTTDGHYVRYIGAIDDNYKDASKVEEKYVENAVDALLGGKQLSLTVTKAIGCSIKDKDKK